MEAYIYLEDGTELKGKSFGAKGIYYGEIVFNTGMTGYQEILTDPSYAGQIVVMTYPLIGNYGINFDDIESNKIQVSGLVVKEYSENPSHWQSNKNIKEFLLDHHIPGIYDIDTRMLTKKIRSNGTMRCIISTELIKEQEKLSLNSYYFPRNIIEKVSSKIKRSISGSGKRIGVVDLGIKNGIIKHLIKHNCDLMIYPYNVTVEEILEDNIDGVLFSNGPGDPKDAVDAINTAKNLIGKIPIFGICLGHQILALALGGKTYKLKFGHRGSNHPVQDLVTGKVFISSQNHGYAVEEKSFTKDMIKTYINVNDETVEGFNCPKFQIYTVQFHPEEGPGPEDAHYIFNMWLDLIERGVINAIE